MTNISENLSNFGKGGNKTCLLLYLTQIRYKLIKKKTAATFDSGKENMK